MRRKGRRADALEHRHEDTADGRDYGFHDANGRYWLGRETKTLCGHWFSSCDDDPSRPPKVWRWDGDSDEVTCPHCLEMMYVRRRGRLF